jgi:3-methyladenine DNA glycosylase Mpg
MGAYWAGLFQTFKSLAQSNTRPQLISTKIGISTGTQKIYRFGIQNSPTLIS